MSVIAKLRAEYVSRPMDPTIGEDGLYNIGGNVRLVAVYQDAAGNKPAENAIFGRYTPSATLQMMIANPRALSQFIPGVEYRVYIRAATMIDETILAPLRANKVWAEKFVAEGETKVSNAEALVAQADTETNRRALSDATRQLEDSKGRLADATLNIEAALLLYSEQQRNLADQG